MTPIRMDNPHRHYRLGILDYHSLEWFMRLPKGFTIDGIEHDLTRNALVVRIRCPERPEYAVEQCLPIPLTVPELQGIEVQSEDQAQCVVVCSWPELIPSEEIATDDRT